MKKFFSKALVPCSAFLFLASCDSTSPKVAGMRENTVDSVALYRYGGFGSAAKWGEHIVTIAGCHDCHTPKLMTPQGPVFDSSRMLSGFPAGTPDFAVNRKEMEGKGLAVTGDLTTWVGPWGISYAANLTSDATGTGNWTEAQFMKALREGKFKGMDNTRPLLPPMPWNVYQYMTDDELKAIFAYLQTTRPISNQVPPPKPPVTAMK
ncbi:diheme cytochrome c-553 [Flavisolibacter sp. BT320]|nr:diheme cytochrome c-553 [Flavisolibacter longurius]